MNVESNGGIEERVAKHAALAELSRLRVVDLLTLGDLSPTEIRLALGAPANLVAHHLNVLETAGLVTRSRSEGDRRRSYVRLADTAFAGLLPGRVERAERVVFVCAANSARSQLAAALWSRHSSIPTASAGTEPAARVNPGALEAASRHGLSLAKQHPHALDDVLRDTDFVVTVCDNAHEGGRVGHLHWSVADPVALGTDEAFEAAYVELEQRVIHLAERLVAA